MMIDSCRSPLSWETLLAYWRGELDPDDEAHTEQHYLGCTQCSGQLQQLIQLAQAVRDVARSGGVDLIINEQFVQRLIAQGKRIREYHVPRNGSVNCTVAPEDDFVVAYLEVPLAGVTQLDLVQIDTVTQREQRYPDIPFRADSSRIVISTRMDSLRALPQSTTRMRLIAVDKNDERVLGDYTFNHSPHTTSANR